MTRAIALVLSFGLLTGPAPAWSTGIIRAGSPGVVRSVPLGAGWQTALGRAFGSKAFAASSVRLGGVLRSLGRVDLADPAKQGSFLPIAEALASLGHTPESFEAIAKSEEGIGELEAAGEIAQRAVDADVQERVKTIAAGGVVDEQTNYQRAVELMKLRAEKALYMDKETLAQLDGAYASARRAVFARAWSAVPLKGLVAGDEDEVPSADRARPAVVGPRPSDGVAAFSKLPDPEAMLGQWVLIPTHWNYRGPIPVHLAILADDGKVPDSLGDVKLIGSPFPLGLPSVGRLRTQLPRWKREVLRPPRDASRAPTRRERVSVPGRDRGR